MVRILQRYVLREVIVPTVLALLTLTFVLLVRMVFSEAENLAGAVTVSTLGRFMLCLLPALLSQAVPMALLIGVLLGIGRLTVDSEVKAMRAHGINLFGVFAPLLVFGLLMTALILYNSLMIAPSLLTRSMGLLDRAKFDLINSLQPGRPYDDFGLPGADTDVVIYFDSKDEDGRMNNVYLSVQGGLQNFEEEAGRDEDLDDMTGSLTDGDAPTETAPDRETAEADAKSSPGLTASLADSVATATAPAFPRFPEIEFGDRRDAWSVPGVADRGNEPSDRGGDDGEASKDLGETKTLILAASGRIEGNPDKQRALLDLYDGSVHFLRGRNDPRYTVVDFKRLRQDFDLDISSSSRKSGKRKPEIMPLPEMLWEIDRRLKIAHQTIENRLEQSPDEPVDIKDVVHKRVHWLWAEIYARISIALACFAFVLIGVPLAILARPSGKSIGITMAFLLILTYYGIMHYGTELTRSGSAVGPIVVFLPNVLLTILGALMFHRTVHR